MRGHVVIMVFRGHFERKFQQEVGCPPTVGVPGLSYGDVCVSRFDTILECDGQADGQTDTR